MNAPLASLLIRAAFMHHADLFGVYQTHKIGMMLECSTGELLSSAAFMYHDDKGYHALKHFAGLRGLLSLMVAT